MTEEISNKKSGNKMTPEAEMSFWEHLEELRWLLVRSFIAVVVMAMIAFLGRKIIFDSIILGPNSPDFLTYHFLCYLARTTHIDGLCYDVIQLKIINYNMAGQFVTHLNISFIAGIILAMPYILREFWRFLKPALNEKERKYSYIAMSVSFMLFIIGILFGYLIIVPLTLYFFAHYSVSSSVDNLIQLSSYINTVVYTTISVGAVFLLPVFMLLMVKMGIMSASFLKRSRKVSFVVILVLATIIGPPDVPSTLILCIPLYGLYELTVWAAGKMEKKAKE
ncbi:MAG: twin-arginine translocase subunit TatC [Bacteroidota bacterium]